MERHRAAHAKLSGRTKRAVQQFGFNARDFHAPVAKLVFVLNVEAVESERSDIQFARPLRRGSRRGLRQVHDIVLVTNDVDDALVDGQVIDRKAPAEHAPRQPDFDTAGNQERTVVMPLGREAHIGERNAAGDRVVAEASRLEFEVVSLHEALGPSQRAAARHRRVHGDDDGQDQAGGNRRQNHQPAPNPDLHHSILGCESRPNGRGKTASGELQLGYHFAWRIT